MLDDQEQPLSGGNVSAGVVRVGDTVRRPAGPWTPAVHALLTHLHEAGFRAAPRPLGIDERGREVLTFVPGDVIWPDRFARVEPALQLARVARLIRDFHDAVQDFIPPPDAQWQVLIPAEGAEIIAGVRTSGFAPCSPVERPTGAKWRGGCAAALSASRERRKRCALQAGTGVQAGGSYSDSSAATSRLFIASVMA
ncbi:hypothetical protein M2271_005081 [Streptomyces sp. LBL]|nr:hypothetical protein [Streptomyces sp. LBL]